MASGDLIRIHMLLKYNPIDKVGLFQIQDNERILTQLDYYLTESRLLMINPDENKLFMHIGFQKNDFTNELRKMMIHISNPKEPGNFIESIDSDNVFKEGIWRLCNHSPSDYSDPLNKNDYFRLGRQIMRVAKIMLENTFDQNDLDYVCYDSSPYSNDSNSQAENNSESQSKRSISTPTCRVCFEKESDRKPFAANICNCRNMPIHINCLKNWMANRIKTANLKNMIYYDITQFSCEVCHRRIEPFITIKGKEVSLLKINIETGTNIVILEVFELKRNKIKGILVLHFPGNQLQEVHLGRSDTSDIQFKDNTISLNHAKFIWKNGKFYIFNVESRYGVVKKVVGKLDLDKVGNDVFVTDKFAFSFHVTFSMRRVKGYLPPYILIF